ncbi:DUF106 domain-containing protein [Candidatus Woesearchaeota archaeon]|nr:DUF106 domain-containing protein [Candidatus Woesearchaeota archaeon]
MLDFLLNPVLGPLLKLPHFAAIAIISGIISLIIVVAYKYFTDQDMMKSLKGDMKKHQAEMKASRDNPKKMMDVQKQMMEKNMKYMMHSFKPTLITFIPLIIIFSWLNTQMGYYPLYPDQPFTVDAFFNEGVTGNVELIQGGLQIEGNATQEIVNGKATWKLQGQAGEYILEYKFREKSYEQPIIISSEQVYKQPALRVNVDGFSSAKVNLVKVTPFGSLSIFGWQPGWLAAYIIFSLVFSIGLRKLMSVY